MGAAYQQLDLNTAHPPKTIDFGTVPRFRMYL